MFWTGLAINVLAACSVFAINLLQYTQDYVTHNESPWVNPALSFANVGYVLCLIVSGCILIKTVFSIRSYLASLGEDGSEINLKTLIIYSLAFGLFLAGCVLNLAFSINFWMKLTPKTKTEYYIAQLICFTFSFVS